MYRSGSIARALGAALLGLALAGCKQEVQLTRTPATGPSPAATQAQRREPTNILFGVPVDFSGLGPEADAALPARFPRIVEWVENAACGPRSGRTECNSARVDVDIQRNGPVELLVEGGRLALKVPLKYDLSARGIQWASGIRETRSGTFVATIALEAGVGAAYAPEVRFGPEVAYTEPKLASLKGRLALAPHLDQRLKKALQPAAETARKAIAAEDLRGLAARAWKALGSPIELAREPWTWLRAEPERVLVGGFASIEGRIELQVAIGARMVVSRGQRPAPLPLRRLPDPTPGQWPEARTELRLPVVIGAEPMLRAARLAFPVGEVLRSVAEVSEPPLGVAVRGLSLYPARGLLGIELQLEIVEPRQWLGLVGTAHLVAQPVMRGESAQLTLERIELPEQKPRRSLSGARPSEKSPASKSPRIGVEPFATRLAKAARLDIGPALRDVLPHANSILNQPLGDGFMLSGRIETARIGAIEPVRDGFEIVFELTGRLSLAHTAASVALARTPAKGPSE